MTNPKSFIKGDQRSIYELLSLSLIIVRYAKPIDNALSDEVLHFSSSDGR